MANAMALFAVQRGMQAGQGIGEAYKQQIFAELNSKALGTQMTEITDRADMRVKQTMKAGERVAAEQEAAFIKGGVDISGSAMETLANTMSEAAEAAYIQKREAGYDLIGIAGNKARLDALATDMNFFLNAGASVGTAFAGYKMDEFAVEGRSNARRGYTGTSDTMAMNYRSGSARGVA